MKNKCCSSGFAKVHFYFVNICRIFFRFFKYFIRSTLYFTFQTFKFNYRFFALSKHCRTLDFRALIICVIISRIVRFFIWVIRLIKRKHFRSLFIYKIPIGQTAAIKNSVKPIFFLRRCPAASVDTRTEYTYRLRNIVCAFHSSLNFKRGNSHIAQLIKMVDK